MRFFEFSAQRHHPFAALCLFTSVAGLAACGGEDGADTTGTTSVSGTTSTSSSTTGVGGDGTTTSTSGGSETTSTTAGTTMGTTSAVSSESSSTSGSTTTSGAGGMVSTTATTGTEGTATSGAGGTGGMGGASSSDGSATTGTVASEPFSFFVTSLEAIRRESGSEDGFGGDLGGLSGADEICTRIAESAMEGAGAKGWRAFLSTTTENAIDRIGDGPWYDRVGRLVAEDLDGIRNERPDGDPQIINDLTNEMGVPNRAGTGSGEDDNHDTITGSNSDGEWDGGSTCDDWTSTTTSEGPRVGHSWPANSGQGWIQAHTAPGCAPSVNLVQGGGGGMMGSGGIGAAGGYGGFYCFALTP